MTDFTRELVRLAIGGVTIAVRRAEIRAVSVHAIDTIVEGIVRCVTLDHEAGDFIETCERDEGWARLVDGLPAFLGFDVTSLRDALDRSHPDVEPIVVFER